MGNHVDGIPDGLENLTENVRIEAPWVVQSADPPVCGGYEPTTPKRYSVRGQVAGLKPLLRCFDVGI